MKKHCLIRRHLLTTVDCFVDIVMIYQSLRFTKVTPKYIIFRCFSNNVSKNVAAEISILRRSANLNSQV